MNSITLQPSSYVCHEHQHDLTAQVRHTLGDGDPDIPVMFRRPDAGPLPFRLIVTCPGATGANPHDLVCTGTYVR